MMAEGATEPCSLCSFFVDGIQGGLPHLLPRSAFAVVAKVTQKYCMDIHKSWQLSCF